MQSAQAISAAYDFDLTAGDYTLADGAIEAVIERAPWSAFINPSQSRELIFYGQSDRLRRRRHTLNAGKFRPDLQEHSKRTMSARAPDPLSRVWSGHVDVFPRVRCHAVRG